MEPPTASCNSTLICWKQLTFPLCFFLSSKKSSAGLWKKSISLTSLKSFAMKWLVSSGLLHHILCRNDPLTSSCEGGRKEGGRKTETVLCTVLSYTLMQLRSKWRTGGVRQLIDFYSYAQNDLKTSSERMWCPQRRFCYLNWWWWALASQLARDTIERFRSFHTSCRSGFHSVALTFCDFDPHKETQFMVSSFNVLVVWYGVTVGLWEES